MTILDQGNEAEQRLNLKLRDHSTSRVSPMVCGFSPCSRGGGGDQPTLECMRAGPCTVHLRDKRQSGEGSVGRCKDSRGCLQAISLILGQPKRLGAVGAKGMQTGDLGKARNDSHFQIVKGKSTQGLFQVAPGSRIRTDGWKMEADIRGRISQWSVQLDRVGLLEGHKLQSQRYMTVVWGSICRAAKAWPHV